MGITIEKEASDRLKEILSEKQIEGSVVRIFMSGSGCSGPMFNLAIDELKENDIHIEFEGMSYVAEKSLIDQYQGFEILAFDNGEIKSIYVQALDTGDSGCSSCSGCN